VPKTKYQKRIASAEWKALKITLMGKRGARCQECGRMTTALHLHHRHYRSVGNEAEADLLLLCPSCHKKQHFVGDVRIKKIPYRRTLSRQRKRDLSWWR
jgi:5-methylcytosine-specific restriction endonuclease McrA